MANFLVKKIQYRFIIILGIGLALVYSERNLGILKYNGHSTQEHKIKKILIIMIGSINQVHGICTRYLSIQRGLAKRGIQVDIMDASASDIVVGNLLHMMPENMLSFSLPRTYLNKYLSGMYDAVHIAEIVTLQSAAAALTFSYYKIPFTMMCHINYDVYNKDYGYFIPESLYNVIPRFISQKASTIFAPTKGICNELKTRYGLKHRRLKDFPNSVNSEVFNLDYGTEYEKVKQYLENKLKLPKPYLLCVSRIAPEKNLDTFFNLEYPGTKIMVGDGPLLETYRKQYGDKVLFVGLKRGRELAAYYQNCDVFVFPSFSETFGLVMIEAMACGTPVAAFPCMGPIDVVDSGITGYLNHDLKNAVDLCLQLPREKVHEGSKRWSIENSMDTFVNNLAYIPEETRIRLRNKMKLQTTVK